MKQFETNQLKCSECESKHKVYYSALLKKNLCGSCFIKNIKDYITPIALITATTAITTAILIS